MNRKKGEQRGRRRLSLSWSVCFPLCYLLTAPGAAKRAHPPPAGAGLCPWCLHVGLGPWAVSPEPPQAAAFQADPHGSVCGDSTSSPFLSHPARCVAFPWSFWLGSAAAGRARAPLTSGAWGAEGGSDDLLHGLVLLWLQHWSCIGAATFAAVMLLDVNITLEAVGGERKT